MTVHWVECKGEAHSNALIDHCAVCAPYWGRYPVCGTCGKRVRVGNKFYMCGTCKSRSRKS